MLNAVLSSFLVSKKIFYWSAVLLVVYGTSSCKNNVVQIYFDPLYSCKMKYFTRNIARHMENMAESTAEDEVQVIKDSQFIFLVFLRKYRGPQSRGAFPPQ
jgi:hypothetical protein